MTLSPQPKILILAPTGQDALLAARILAEQGMPSDICLDLRDLVKKMDADTGALVIAEEAVVSADVPLLVDHLARQAPWSDIPLIILTSGGESAQNSLRTLNWFGPSGNVTFLERPFRTMTLISAIKVALRSRIRQYEVRELLADRDRVLASINDAFVTLDHDWKLTYVNDKAVTLVGLSREAMLGQNIWALFPGIYNSKAAEQIRLAAEQKSNVHFEHFDLENGKWYECRVYPSPTGLSIFAADITQRKQTERQLLHGAYHDALTGLPNQALFLDMLRQAIHRSRQHTNYKFAVLFLDLDRFKVINDSLGHMIGDQLLVAIAQRLSKGLRPGDTLARFGGDEFTIFLDNINDVSEAIQVAERVHTELTPPLSLEGYEVFTSASIGITMNAQGVEKPEDVLRDADIAMYRAKSRGRSCYEVFHGGMHAHAVEIWELEGDLRRAVEREELHIHYQPIVSLSSGKVIGVEALTRWDHPQRGLVYPKEFIGLAEETGLIVPIGEIILRKACMQLKAWHNAGYRDLTMAVNCSTLQFQNKNLATLIRHVLEESSLTADKLKIEITESLAMKDIDFSIKTLHELNEMGVHVAIDDFGTGYSSLSYLRHFPIDTLKIDYSFIRDMHSNTDNAAIVGAIIAMAHSLKLNVVAEGVEVQEQLDMLREQGCDSIQGFLFSEPLSPEMFTSVLKEKRHFPASQLATTPYAGAQAT